MKHHYLLLIYFCIPLHCYLKIYIQYINNGGCHSFCRYKLEDDLTCMGSRYSHLPEYISISDLIRDVSQDLPDNTPIPSESTVLFSLVPKNSHCKSSNCTPQKYLCNSRYKLVSFDLLMLMNITAVQYSNTIFKYTRQYAMEF